MRSLVHVGSCGGPPPRAGHELCDAACSRGEIGDALVGLREGVGGHGWAELCFPAMVFRQIVHDDLGCASYLVGDEDAGTAAVVDPRFEIDPYLQLARYVGVEINHVLETHNHADHVSGHGRLSAATGATIHI